ncbi:MAG: helix-turn-helix domain-containing protein [Methylomonas sp.]|jgi:excisionase family DNA binding protein
MAQNKIITNQAKVELFTNAQAAAYIGVEPGTLEVWRSTKRYNLPFIKVGRLVKYRKESLDAFLESRTVGVEV